MPNLKDHLRWDTVQIGRKSFLLCEVVSAQGPATACWRAQNQAGETVLLNFDGREIKQNQPKRAIPVKAILQLCFLLFLVGGGFWLGRDMFSRLGKGLQASGTQFVTEGVAALPNPARQRQLEEFFDLYTQALNTNETSDDMALIAFSGVGEKIRWERILRKFNVLWPKRLYQKPATLVLSNHQVTGEWFYQQENVMSKSTGSVKLQFEMEEEGERLRTLSVKELAKTSRELPQEKTETNVKQFVREFVSACGSESLIGPRPFYASEASYKEEILTEDQFSLLMKNQASLPALPSQELERIWQSDQRRWLKRTLQIVSDDTVEMEDKDKIELKNTDNRTVRVRCFIIEDRETRTGRKERIKYWNRLRVHMGERALEITSHLRIKQKSP